MVQQRAARFIFNDYSYNTSVTSLLNTLNWSTLQNCRINLRAIMLHKIINNLIVIPADSLLLHNSSSKRHHHHCSSIAYSRISAPFFHLKHQDLELSEPQTACSPSLKIYKDRISKEKLPTSILNL